MGHSLTYRAASILLALLFLGTSALAGTVGYGDHVAASYFTGDGDGDPNTFSGSRTTSNANEMVGTNAWATGLTVDFLVTDLGTGVFQYKYTFTGFPDSSEISHFTLDWSNDLNELTARNAANFKHLTSGALDFGDLDGIIGAVKFDSGGLAGVFYKFEIERAPMWGDLLLKDGGGKLGATDSVSAKNVGYDNHLTFTDSLNYIPVPNSTTTNISAVVPLPSSAWVGLALLAGLVAIRRYRRMSRTV